MMVTSTELKRGLSSSAPELQSVTGGKALMVASLTQIMMLDNGQCTDTGRTEDMVESAVGNTMETDDSSGMNQEQQVLVGTNSVVDKNLNHRLGSESATISTAALTNTTTTTATTTTTTSSITGGIVASSSPMNTDAKTKGTKNKKAELSSRGMKNGSPTIALSKSLIRRQTRSINSMLAIKLKTLFLLINLLLVILSCLDVVLVQAGFWTFYFPNFLKPSGYKELTGMIEKVEADLNETMDTFADIQYFWGQMEEIDKLEENSIYPEESACAEVFPLFRNLAIEYSYIDYEHFLKPMQGFYDLLLENRAEWYPEGPKSKTILPRELEQNLYEADLSLKIFWLSKLANNPQYKSKREQMVSIWRGVKRNLDSSIPCIYLRYAYRQIAEDINQLSLDNNLDGMREAADMVKAAYKRIDKFSNSDEKAKREIEDAKKKQERLNI